MPTFDTTTYISPFTWRYGSQDMRRIFSERHKYELWRKVWISLARVQHKVGLVSDEELTDLEQFAESIDIEKILEIEKDTKHDVVAAIREYAEKAKVGGGKIHLGLTSMDIVDNTEGMRNYEAMNLIEAKVKKLLGLFADKIDKYADTVCLGYTHLQPAEPTTVGYRFAFYAQDLLTDLKLLEFIQSLPLGKGIKGAVGTQASFASLLQEREKGPLEMETEVMQMLGIRPVDISSQVYSRKIDYLVLTVLASIASSIAKFAADLRILQSPTIGEWSEPFGSKQVGSSAMPFKKNPINSEKICSLARLVATMPTVALENATHSYLERTLDDSANRRIVTPEAFLAVDEILMTAAKLVDGMVINEKRIAFNLQQFAPFIASEGILMEAVKKGASRQDMHEVLRDTSMQAWASVAEGRPNPMTNLLQTNTEITKFVSIDEIKKQLDVSLHVGTAQQRAKKLAADIRKLA
ncbi:MAG: adenylosuccinate lyase [Patescibacteria group bacterium]|nr:adenylosuccinate lyase [Patescibacteria group bacterium]MDE2589303.1 adenylosuccinate lyase [Patescibacteria group bacterium]